MRAIIINPEDKSITEREISGNLDSLKELVGGWIELVRIIDYDNDIWVNEEGLLLPEIFRKGFFMYGDYPNPLAGVGVVLGHTKGGDSAATKLDIETLRSKIKFYTLDEIRMGLHLFGEKK